MMHADILRACLHTAPLTGVLPHVSEILILHSAMHQGSLKSHWSKSTVPLKSELYCSLLYPLAINFLFNSNRSHISHICYGATFASYGRTASLASKQSFDQVSVSEDSDAINSVPMSVVGGIAG